MRKRHRLLGLGGTFDHFHEGHAQLLLFASELTDKILVGVTTERMTKHKAFLGSIESYETRVSSVSRFCQRHHIACQIVKLQDPIGPTLEDSKVEALAVTAETLPGANKINELRQNLGLRELPIYICDFFLTSAHEPLHADAIRTGYASRQGLVYDTILTESLILNVVQRAFFQNPQGEIVNKPQSEGITPLIAVVGDRCLETFISHRWPYHLGIFDEREQRQPMTSETLKQLTTNYSAQNPAGIISQELSQCLKQILKTTSKTPQHLKIDGEEDLAAVALVLLAPLNSQIFYGQPQQGMVKMVVTEALKDTFYNILAPDPSNHD